MFADHWRGCRGHVNSSRSDCCPPLPDENLSHLLRHQHGRRCVESAHQSCRSAGDRRTRTNIFCRVVEGLDTPHGVNMIGTGLIGFGASGRTFHAPVIHAVPGMRLAAVLQRSGDDAAKLYSDARLVRSMEEMLALPGISLVVITTPNTSHYPLARQCLLAGKHVVVD